MSVEENYKDKIIPVEEYYKNKIANSTKDELSKIQKEIEDAGVMNESLKKLIDLKKTFNPKNGGGGGRRPDDDAAENQPKRVGNIENPREPCDANINTLFCKQYKEYRSSYLTN